MQRGGKPIVIRLVKGANLEMERVEASLMNWPQAPYKTKRTRTPISNGCCVEGFKPENLQAVRLGIASHNLFEVSFALILALENNALQYVQFEMLEGMANHQRRALFEICQSLLLYAPACRREDFIHAIGYLVRRLDENTGPDNFLRHAFKLEVGSPDWQRLEAKFVESYQAMHTVSDAPRRTQDRHQPRGRTDGARPSLAAVPERTGHRLLRWCRTRSGPKNWSPAGSGRRPNIRPTCRWTLPGRW